MARRTTSILTNLLVQDIRCVSGLRRVLTASRTWRLDATIAFTSTSASNSAHTSEFTLLPLTVAYNSLDLLSQAF